MGDTVPRQDPGREIPESPEEVREASMRLPARQREALTLREREGLSYDEIAATMEVNRNTVAQLISRGRINLLDELRGTALASGASPTPECERALPLIAMRDDGQLEAASGDAAWLDDHLAGCERCRLEVEAMREASAAYRTSAPIESPAMPSPQPLSPHRDKPPRRRAMALAAGLTGLLLLAGIATVLAGDDPPSTPADTASGPNVETAAQDARPTTAGKTNGDAAKKKAQIQTTAEETTPTVILTPIGSSAPNDSQPNRSPGKAAIQPTQQTSASKPQAKPAPSPAPPAQPASVPAPATEEPPSSSREPPRGNKPPNHPSSNRNS